MIFDCPQCLWQCFMDIFSMCILWFVQVCRAPGDILERRQLCPRAGDLKTNLRYHQTLNKDKAPLSAYKKIIKWTITSELLDLNWLLATAQNFCLCTKLLLFRHCCQKVLADSVQIVSFFHEWNRLQGSEKSVQLQLAPTLRHQACGNANFIIMHHRFYQNHFQAIILRPIFLLTLSL